MPRGCFLNTSLKDHSYAYRKHTASTTPRDGKPGGIGATVTAPESFSVHLMLLQEGPSPQRPRKQWGRHHCRRAEIRHKSSSLELPKKQQEEAGRASLALPNAYTSLPCTSFILFLAWDGQSWIGKLRLEDITLTWRQSAWHPQLCI